MLVHLFLALGFEEDLVWLTVLFAEVDGCGNVEIVLESGYVKEYGMSVLQHAISLIADELKEPLPQ